MRHVVLEKSVSYPLLMGLMMGTMAAVGAQGDGPSGECALPGPVIRWEASYCMAIAETDDLEADSVSECLSDFSLPGYARSMDECERKRILRRAMCELLITRQRLTRSIEDCVNSPDTIPPFVLQAD